LSILWNQESRPLECLPISAPFVQTSPFHAPGTKKLTQILCDWSENTVGILSLWLTGIRRFLFAPRLSDDPEPPIESEGSPEKKSTKKWIKTETFWDEHRRIDRKAGGTVHGKDNLFQI
jgi:hypothetical protein